MLIIACLGELLWFFGIHGSNATSAITNTLYLPLSIANAQALTAGIFLTVYPQFLLPGHSGSARQDTLSWQRCCYGHASPNS
jgi:cellobiose-specific phosphotransferase system component IIC